MSTTPLLAPRCPSSSSRPRSPTVASTPSSSAITDMQGRLQGKRIHAPYFVERGAAARHRGLQLPARRRRRHEHGRRLRACRRWTTGYGDFVMAPDLGDAAARAVAPRRRRWCMADVLWHDGVDVVASPRQILERQLARARRRRHGRLRRHRARVHRLRRHLRGGVARGLPRHDPGQPLQRRLLHPRHAPGSSRCCARSASAMAGAGLQVESAKGECNLGQHEIAFLYDDALTTCDNHVVYKTAAKEIAAQEGCALTFMAKYDEREGNSCHIHLSFRGLDGAMVMADEDDPENGMSDVGRSFIAGQLAHMQELSLLFAPNINSYKRFAAGLVRADRDRVGPRQPHLRAAARRARRRAAAGEPRARRRREPLPRGGRRWSRPASTASRRAGAASRRSTATPTPPTARRCRAPARTRSTCGRARSGWPRPSATTCRHHYANMGRIELEAFGRAVTDWERFRGFERL